MSCTTLRRLVFSPHISNCRPPRLARAHQGASLSIKHLYDPRSRALHLSCFATLMHSQRALLNQRRRGRTQDLASNYLVLGRYMCRTGFNRNGSFRSYSGESTRGTEGHRACGAGTNMEKSQGSREAKSEERSESAANIERKTVPSLVTIALLLGFGAGGGVMYYFCPELRNIRERRAIDKEWATVESSWERQQKPKVMYYGRPGLPLNRWNEQRLLEKEAILLLKEAVRLRKDQESLDRQKELWALNDYKHKQWIDDYAAWKVEYLESLNEWGFGLEQWNWKNQEGQMKNSSASVQPVDRSHMTFEEQRFFNSFPQVIGSNSTHATNQVLPQKTSSDSKSTEKKAATSSRMLASEADESTKEKSNNNKDTVALQQHEQTKREKLESLRKHPEASKSDSKMGPGAIQALSIGIGMAIGIATAVGVSAMGGQ